MTTRLLLVRHGETVWNENGRFQGFSDVELSPLGRRQVGRLADFLAAEPLAAVHSSTLQRARDTARAIADRHGVEVILTDRLKELNQGDLEGLDGAEFRRRYPDLVPHWRTEPATLRLPNGESLADVQARAWPVVEEIIRDHPEHTVALVSHNFVLHTLLCRALGLHLNDFRRLQVDLGSVSVVEFRPTGTCVTLLNARQHLQGA